MKAMGTVLRCLCCAAFAILGAAVASSFCHAADAPLVLENQRVLLEMDPACGTICRMLDKSSGIELAPARDLAENFRLLVLLPHKKKATILGKDQKLSGVKRTADGLKLSWNGPLRDTAGGEHKINVRMEVKAVGSELQFGLHLDNGTAGKVENVWYPIVGGLAHFGRTGKAGRRSALDADLRADNQENGDALRLDRPCLSRANEPVVYLRRERPCPEIALLCRA